MLTLEKVQLLEERIKKAVSLINRLREENASLNEQIQILKTHNDELKEFSKNYTQDSELIETGISKAISQLDRIEGLSDEIPVEDLNRSVEFEQLDTAASGSPEPSRDSDDDNQIPDEPIIGYEDEDDPLI